MKLMQYIWQCYLPELVEKNEEDAASAVSRLKMYLEDQKYLREPEGRRLQMNDASSHDRA